MKILLIFTGGTIGSTVKDGWIDTNQTAKYNLIEKYHNLTNDRQTEFIVRCPYTILSENISANEINLLQECIFKENLDKYDGIIITHGTDTLHYTSAILSYLLSQCKIPVIFVSSDYPLEYPKANGLNNFRAAVNFIAKGTAGGVFVSYKNQREAIVNIHKATRITLYPEALANIYSIDNEPFAFYDETNDLTELNSNYNNTICSKGLGQIQLCPSPEILMINSFPEDSYDYNIDKCKSIILTPYHSGTLNTSSNRLEKFCKKAHSKNIPIFLVNGNFGIEYKSSSLFPELGIEVLPPCTKTSIFAKCWIALSCKLDLIDFVKKPIAEEFYI